MRAGCGRRWAYWWGVLLLAPISAPAADPTLAGNANDLRLIDAAKRQDPAAVRALLKEPGINVNARQGDGATALEWAVYWQDGEDAGLLMHAGADVNAANDLGVTPLALACKNGNAAIAKALLEAGANTNAAQASGETVLMTASWTGNAEVVKQLLAHGSDPNVKEPSRGQTALMWAIGERHPDVVRLLIEGGADVRVRSKGGSTPLLLAARMGDLESAQLLLSHGADVNETMPKERKDLSGMRFPASQGRDSGADGASALLIATIRGSVELAKFLLDHGADPNASGAGYTTLHWAAGSWESFASIIFGLGGSASRAPDEYRAKFGLQGEEKLEMVKALLVHGADPNARMERARYNTVDEDGVNALGVDTILRTRLDGATPFALAAEAGDVAVMRVLIDAGADPKLATKQGTTPLMLDAGLGRNASYTFMTENRALAAAKLLLDLGADVNAANDAGNTALHGAAHMRYEQLIQLLVAHGAELNVKNVDGQTPLAVAERSVQLFGNPVIELHTSAGDLLRKLGAR
jgi:ankyrin repeat protein